jgi:hypothetical protein
MIYLKELDDRHVDSQLLNVYQYAGVPAYFDKGLNHLYRGGYFFDLTEDFNESTDNYLQYYSFKPMNICLGLINKHFLDICHASEFESKLLLYNLKINSADDFAEKEFSGIDFWGFKQKKYKNISHIENSRNKNIRDAVEYVKFNLNESKGGLSIYDYNVVVFSLLGYINRIFVNFYPRFIEYFFSDLLLLINHSLDSKKYSYKLYCGFDSSAESMFTEGEYATFMYEVLYSLSKMPCSKYFADIDFYLSC